MQETEFHAKIAHVLASLYPSWYKHRWNEETATELWNLVGSHSCQSVTALLREFYQENNSFSHAEFAKAVQKRFKRGRHKFDPAKWTVENEHHYRMFWRDHRRTFAAKTDAEFDAMVFKFIGKTPTQEDRAEATAILNAHIKEANARLAERSSKVRLREFGEIDPGF